MQLIRLLKYKDNTKMFGEDIVSNFNINVPYSESVNPLDTRRRINVGLTLVHR